MHLYRRITRREKYILAFLLPPLLVMNVSSGKVIFTLTLLLATNYSSGKGEVNK